MSKSGSSDQTNYANERWIVWLLRTVYTVVSVILTIVLMPFVLIIAAVAVVAAGLFMAYWLFQLWRHGDDLETGHEWIDPIQSSLEDQLVSLPEIRDHLDALKAAIETSADLRNSDWREVATTTHRDYLKLRGLAGSQMLEESREWLADYEEVIGTHPDAHPWPAEIRQQLEAIGTYGSAEWGEVDGLGLFWRSPAGVDCDWTNFTLYFGVATQDELPDARILELWNIYKARHASLLDEYRTRISRHHPETTDWDEIRDQIRGAIVYIQRADSPDLEEEMRVTFDCEWEIEHLVGFELNNKAEILDWLM